MALLEVKNLVARIGDTRILNGVSLTIGNGEVHAIMGPNGSGKSTLAKVLSGHPGYEVESGEVLFDGVDLFSMEADERARAGMFLAFQYPAEIPGVSNLNFLRTALAAKLGRDVPVVEFRKMLMEKMKELGMDPSFATRFVNEGFSGGEKKRNEILQLSILDPKLALLDETDSGLDIDALKIVAEGVNRFVREGASKPGVLVITHYNRILNYLKPDFVHIFHQGRIISSGGQELALKLEEQGYEWIVDAKGSNPGSELSGALAN